MKTITYYEATDGTLFATENACKQYEDNLKETIINNFKKLIVREGEGFQITNNANAFAMAECGECWWYAVIVLKTEDDYCALQKFTKLTDGDIDRIKPIYDTEIFVGIGDGTSNECEYNYLYWYGTVDEMIENYANTLRTFNIKEDK